MPRTPPQPVGERRCTATSKRTGQRCGQWSVVGGTVCRFHGGASPQVAAKAEQRVAHATVEADATALLAAWGHEGVADPLTELGRVTARVLAMTDDKGGEQLRSEVAVYERSLDRSLKALDVLMRHQPDSTAAKAGSLLESLATALGVDQPDNPT